MIRKVFVWKNSERFGNFGWVPATQPTFDPNLGLGVAHDTLEHGLRDLPDLTAEVVAFGAMVNVRGIGGYFLKGRIDKYATPEWQLGNTLADFALEALGIQSTDFNATLRAVGKVPKVDDDDAEDIIRGALDVATKGAVEGGKTYGENVDQAELSKVIQQFGDMMRFGYARSCRRFRGVSSDELSYLFESLESTINRQYKSAEVGDRISVGVDPKSLALDIRVIAPTYVL
jgi:hypothetical protein